MILLFGNFIIYLISIFVFIFLKMISLLLNMSIIKILSVRISNVNNSIFIVLVNTAIVPKLNYLQTVFSHTIMYTECVSTKLFIFGRTDYYSLFETQWLDCFELPSFCCLVLGFSDRVFYLALAWNLLSRPE